MEYQACYAIRVTNKNNLSRFSNFSSIEYPGGVIFNFAPDDMLKHPFENYVYVYNADDLTLQTTISTDRATAGVVIDGKGHIIASVDPSPWWEQPVRTYSRDNGMYIDGYDGSDVNEKDRTRLISGTSEIISISTTVSPVDMEYFKIGNDGIIESPEPHLLYSVRKKTLSFFKFHHLVVGYPGSADPYAV